MLNIAKKLAQYTKGLNTKFSLNDRPITPDEIFSENSLLPAIIRRADQLCSFCLGYGLGVTFDETKDTKLGVKVKFDESTPDSLRLMCAVEIVYEIIEAAPNREVVALDDLLYD